ncbi:thiol:disulfide interchange protein DsbD [Otariodibacter oris]|uniref:Thiol:disulfide interchange protein DsbD n=1 Tax=Otariodibacter oris TaxID=1032623 RepID=A0A420XI03_9PAST|nr:thiol:disulfide interchange protein DsbD [Otariodibacter oris]
MTKNTFSMIFARFFTLLISLLVALPAMAGLFDKKPEFLRSEDAFRFSYEQMSDKVDLNWQIADGYYLYKKEIQIKSENNTLGKPVFPPSESHEDEFFGITEIFRNQLKVEVPVQNQSSNSTIEVRYQGCTTGFCYPPQTVNVKLSPQAVSFLPDSATLQAEQNVLANNLATSQLSIFWFFILGIGLAFTPCVLPMLPLLSAIVIGNKNRPNMVRAFLLSLTYVQGMALTYTLLGLIVAAIGLPFQVALQSPPVLIGLSVLFIILASSMFGLFTIQLPHSWQQKLNEISQKQQGGAYPSVFVMGMIAGLVASPCTSAPLSGALLYVAQSGDILTGGLALYLLALGMGLPLVLVTLFGNQILPKSGDWLLKVKTIFGFVMLALPVFLLSRLLPSYVEPLMWSALSVAFLIWLIDQFATIKIWQKLVRVALILGMVVVAKPWADLVWNQSPVVETTESQFTQVSSLAELQQKIAENPNKKVMFDLYADWCVACKEFEKYTFSDPQVKSQLDNMLLLRVDMTKNSEKNDELMEHFNVLGLPTILFFDEKGNELGNSRITGEMKAPEFSKWLNQL